EAREPRHSFAECRPAHGVALIQRAYRLDRPRHVLRKVETAARRQRRRCPRFCALDRHMRQLEPGSSHYFRRNPPDVMALGLDLVAVEYQYGEPCAREYARRDEGVCTGAEDDRLVQRAPALTAKATGFMRLKENLRGPGLGGWQGSQVARD